MSVRLFASRSRRLATMLMAGSLSLSAVAKAQETVPTVPATIKTPTGISAADEAIMTQPIAGPFGEFRIKAFSFLRNKKSESKFTPSRNIPKPPAGIPVLEPERTSKTTRPNARSQQKPQPRATNPQPKTLKQPTIVKQPTPRTTSPLRSRPSVRTTLPPPAPDDGWVARKSINQSQPLRDPGSATATSKTAPGGSADADKKVELITQPREQLRPLTNNDKSATDPLPRRAVKDLTAASTGDEPKPNLTGPALNAPKTDSSPEAKNTASADLSANDKSDRQDSATEKSAAAAESKTKTSEAKPNTKSAGRTSTTADLPYGGSDTQYVGTEPRQTELDYTGRPLQPIQLSSRVRRMKPGIERVLRYYYQRPEIADKRSNWGMMHAIMVYGVDTRILAGRKSYSAIGWIAGNNYCRGKKLLLDDDKGIMADNGVGLQGHQAQFLTVLSLCDVPKSYPLYAGDNKYSVADLIKREMAACKSGEELTFTLIGLSHYLDTNASWIASDGERWDMPRLIREELSQPIVGSACGGTHRLMGFGHALRKRRAEGRPITGQWARAEKFTRDFVHYAYQLQNRDGSMSTRWFEGRADEDDTDRKIQTTGHIVEWLLTVTPDEHLQNQRLVSAVTYLLNAMHRDLQHEWEIGPKGHALRSLAMFYERVYKAGPAWKRDGIASSGNRTTR